MKCFVIAHCISETRVMIPVFKSVQEACDYCLRVIKYPNEIKMFKVYSVGSHLTKLEAEVHNCYNIQYNNSECSEDDLPF